MPLTGECGTLSRPVPIQLRVGDDLTSDASKSDTAKSEYRASRLGNKKEIFLHFKQGKEVGRTITLLEFFFLPIIRHLRFHLYNESSYFVVLL